MYLNRKELLDTLTKIKPALAEDNSAIQQGRNFIFNKNIIYAKNKEIAIVQNFQSDIVGAIEAKKFYDLLQKMKSDEIKITLNENEILIEDEKTKAGIKYDPEIIVFPLDTKDKEFNRLPDDFVEGLEFCIFSAANDSSRFPLDCLFINKKQIISCDSYRLTSYTLDKVVSSPFLLPEKTVKHLISYKIVRYCIDSEWIHFKTEDDIIISCQVVNGTYPNVSHLFEVEGDIIELPKDFISSIERAKIIQDDIVSVELFENKLICKAKSETEWIEESAEIEYSGEWVTFKVNPIFFKEVLSKNNKIVLGKNSLLFEDEKFKHVLALLVEKNA